MLSQTLKVSLLSILFAPITMSQSPIKIACVGDSIATGHGTSNPGTDAFPAQLQTLLGNTYEVKNFGVSGYTMLKKGDLPWVNHPYCRQSFDYAPDIVIIKLGTNDSKGKNWKFKNEFKADTLSLIAYFRSLSNKPRIILCTPVPATTPSSTNPHNIPGPTLLNEVAPLVRLAAKEAKVEFVDLFKVFIEQGAQMPSLFADGIHPNTEGATIIAKTLQTQILRK